MTDQLSHRWVDRDEKVGDLLEELSGEPRYALDTEFHRERTYFPKLALVQIAWTGGLALIDPLTTDIRALATLFERDAIAVVHAAQQDLDVLTHAVGAVPRRLWDTQLAAGFVGYGTPSLVSLLQGELGITPAKGDRLTDWLRRPLAPEQCRYAATDVAHLLEVQDRLATQLSSLGRERWVEDACQELLDRPVGALEPSEAWLRLKDARTLRPRARAVARSVAAWRERRAMDTDQPVRHVLADLAVLGISQRQPRSRAELGQCRGVDDRVLRSSIVDELLDAVRQGLEAEPPELPTGGDELDRELRPAVTLVSAWVSQLAREQRLETALLATRADLIALLRGDADARLARGWRAEVLGDGIRALVEGRAALTFRSEGGLRLIDLNGDGSAPS